MWRRSLDSVEIYSPKYSREDIIRNIREKVELMKVEYDKDTFT